MVKQKPRTIIVNNKFACENNKIFSRNKNSVVWYYNILYKCNFTFALSRIKNGIYNNNNNAHNERVEGISR